MRTLINVNLLVILFSLLMGCQNAKNNIPVKEITIYGAESCYHCRDLKTSLDSAGWKYEFNDVEIDMTKHQIMLDLVKKHQITGHISYPIVLVGDQLVVGANIKKLVEKM